LNPELVDETDKPDSDGHRLVRTHKLLELGPPPRLGSEGPSLERDVQIARRTATGATRAPRRHRTVAANVVKHDRKRGFAPHREW
jgi:hypothetical protein